LSRPRGWVLDALAVLGLGFVAWECLYKFNGGFDALAYHLPFAALRTGILRPDQFTLPPLLADRLAGFPPLADWVQGGLWLAVGRAEAAALIAPLAVLGFALYGRLAFGLPLLWSILIFIAVPILHTALDGMYVDLWTNAAFAVHLLAAYRAVTVPRRAAWHALGSMLALSIAVWSKPQFTVVGALSFVLLAGLLVRRGPDWRALAVCVLLLPLAFFWPLRDLLRFGNPVYPIAIHLGPLDLPGTQSNAWDGPAGLRRAPDAVRYLLSQLDLDAVNARPGGYTLDQGLQPAGSPGYRMGGSLAVLLLASVSVLAIGLRRATAAAADAAVAGGAFLLLVAIVATLPGAHELRYFSFVEILAVFSALCVLRAQAASGDAYAAGLSAGLQALLASAAVYTTFITGGAHLLARHQPTLHDMARAQAEQDGLAAALQNSATLCYVRDDFRGLLFTGLFAPYPPGGAARVVEAYAPAECPPGSAVVGAGR
jgi:hypothetical protein